MNAMYLLLGVALGYTITSLTMGGPSEVGLLFIPIIVGALGLAGYEATR